jgi:hypothetical protein
MIELIILSVVIAFVVGLLLAEVLPLVLNLLKVEIAVAIGGFFAKWGWPLGVAAGLWYFFTKGHF